ncbi:MAG: YceI family protein [Paracoccaceae bacterium]
MTLKSLALTSTLALMALPAVADQTEWTLDLGHAHLGWEIDHMDLARTAGRFDTFEGTFLIDEDNPENSAISITVDAASVNSNHIGRDNHIRNADLLNVASFPLVTFTSEAITMRSETEGTMTGTVTLLGNSAPVNLDFTLIADRAYPDFISNYDEIRTVSFEATGSVDRTALGMDFIAFPGSPIGTVIDLDIHIDLVDCGSLPEAVQATNVPCNWGYVEGFTGPNES